MNICRRKCNVFSDFDSDHAEFEPSSFYGVITRFIRWLTVPRYWQISLVSGDDCVVYCLCNIPEYVQCDLGRDIEKFPILPDPQVGQSVDGLMNQFLDFIELGCLHCGKDLKG